MCELVKAARHKTEKNALIYSRDASTLLEIAKSTGKLVGTIDWRSTYVLEVQHASNLAGNNKKSLIDISKLFVEKVLKVSKVFIFY